MVVSRACERSAQNAPLVICQFQNLWNMLSTHLSKLMFILILESVFLLFTPQNNYLFGAFHLVRVLNMKVVLMEKYTFSVI